MSEGAQQSMAHCELILSIPHPPSTIHLLLLTWISILGRLFPSSYYPLIHTHSTTFVDVAIYELSITSLKSIDDSLDGNRSTNF